MAVEVVANSTETGATPGLNSNWLDVWRNMMDIVGNLVESWMVKSPFEWSKAWRDVNAACVNVLPIFKHVFHSP